MQYEWLELQGSDSCPEDRVMGCMAAPPGATGAEAIVVFRARAEELNAGGFTVYGSMAHFREVLGDALLDRRDDSSPGCVLHVRRGVLAPADTPRDALRAAERGSPRKTDAGSERDSSDSWTLLEVPGAVPMAIIAAATGSFARRALLSPTASSGQSEIYRCDLDLPYGRAGASPTGVVVKRIVAHAVTGWAAFDNELATLRRCHHPRLLPLLAFARCDAPEGTPHCPEPHRCIVTPFLCGGSLDERLLRCGGGAAHARLGWVVRLSIAVDAFTALHALHEQFNTLHYDVKSANIVLDRSGRAVLCDFGFAAHMGDAGPRSGASSTGPSPPPRPVAEASPASALSAAALPVAYATLIPATDPFSGSAIDPGTSSDDEAEANENSADAEVPTFSPSRASPPPLPSAASPARQLGSTRGMSSCARQPVEWGVVGTTGYTCVDYMKRSEHDDRPTYHRHCDLYSMGVVLLELLSSLPAVVARNGAADSAGLASRTLVDAFNDVEWLAALPSGTEPRPFCVDTWTPRTAARLSHEAASYVGLRSRLRSLYDEIAPQHAAQADDVAAERWPMTAPEEERLLRRVRAICARRGAGTATKRGGTNENVLNAFFRGVGEELAKIGGGGRQGAQSRALAALASKKGALGNAARSTASDPAPCIVVGRAMLRLALRCTHADPTRRPSVAAARDELVALLVRTVVHGEAHVTPASAASPQSPGREPGLTAQAQCVPPPSYSEAVAPGAAVVVEPPLEVGARVFKRPRGRTPRGRVWDTKTGVWRVAGASASGGSGSGSGSDSGSGSGAAFASAAATASASDAVADSRAMPSVSDAAQWRQRALAAEIRADALQSERASLVARCAEAEELSRRLNQRIVRAESGTSSERAAATGEMRVRTAFAREHRSQSPDLRGGIGCMERAWTAQEALEDSVPAQHAASRGASRGASRRVADAVAHGCNRDAAIARALSAEDGSAVVSATRSAETSPYRSSSPISSSGGGSTPNDERASTPFSPPALPKVPGALGMLGAFVSGALQGGSSGGASDPAADAPGSSAVEAEHIDQFALMMGIPRDAAAAFLRNFRARQDRARLQDSGSPEWRSPRRQRSEEFIRAACDAWFRQLVEASDQEEVVTPAAHTADGSPLCALCGFYCFDVRHIERCAHFVSDGAARAARGVALQAGGGALDSGSDVFARSPQHAPF